MSASLLSQFCFVQSERLNTNSTEKNEYATKSRESVSNWTRAEIMAQLLSEFSLSVSP